MILNKALILKGLAGITAIGGAVTVGVVGSGSLGSGNDSSDSGLKLDKLLEKVGLSGCTTENNTTECSISNLKVKHESGSGEENKTKNTASSGKIKVYSDDTYSNKFKFVIEDGDISFNNSNGNTITKLEQFETYEIKEEDSSNKWFLTRKTKASEGIKTALGLPDGCNLPVNSNTPISCENISTENLKAINFEGKTQDQAITVSGTATLTITKLSTSDSDFPFDYKFELKASSNSTTTLTLGNSNTITLQQNTATEFRIKKTTGNNITLEELWSLKNQGERVGLDCNSSDKTCSLKTEGKINIKQDQKSEIDAVATSTSSSGKIKVYTGDQTSDYNKGFKFVIEGGDITVGSDASKKLEQFETYEIKKEESENKWYLTRKKKAEDEIKRLLGLPSNGNSCTLPTSANNSTTCSNISGDDLKAINFEGKKEGGATINSNGTVTLTISKVSDTTTFPLGYKFAFDPTEEVTISSSNKIAKKSGTEFKIKVTQSSGTTPVSLALEKAWTVTTLAAKVGLNCPDPSGGSSDKKCTFTNDSINVKGDDSKKIDGAKLKNSDDSSGKKMSYQEDQENYSQGFKFTVDGSGCIELSKNGTSDDTTIPKIENNGNSYEIKEDGGKWYLTKKANSGSS